MVELLRFQGLVLPGNKEPLASQPKLQTNHNELVWTVELALGYSRLTGSLCSMPTKVGWG